MSPAPRPLFAEVGRRKRGPGDERSAALLLLVAVGMAAAIGAFFWEQATRSEVRVVEVTWMPKEAAAAEAQIEAESAPEP